MVVRGLQEFALKAVKACDQRLDESDIIDRLDRFCAQKEFNDDVRTFLAGSLRKAMNDFQVQMGSQEVQAFNLVQEANGLQTTKPSENPASGSVSQPPARVDKVDSKFLIVYTRNKCFARLHRMVGSNCPWIRVQVQDCIAVNDLKPGMYNSRCKICWPRQEEAEEDSESEICDG